MKWFHVLLMLFPLAIQAADLAKDLEILKVQMRIDDMWHQDESFRAGLDALLQKGYPRNVILAHPAFGDQWKKTTRDNMAEMKKIIAKWGWPSISVFGARTDQQAYVLVDRADDLSFDEVAISALEKAVEHRDTQPAFFATLWDRVRVARHQAQRYGTQGECKGKGVWEPTTLEDAANVNHRRRVMGLESMEDARQKNNRACLVSPNLNE